MMFKFVHGSEETMISLKSTWNNEQIRIWHAEAVFDRNPI